MGGSAFRALACCALALGLAAPAAFGHSKLTTSTPASGATMDGGGELVLRFSDPVDVDPDGVRVYELGGREVPAGPAVVDGRTVTVPVQEEGRGTRAVQWRARSDHGDPIDGGFVYHVGTPTEGSRAVTAPSLERRQELAHLGTGMALGALVLATLVAAGGLLVRRAGHGWPGAAVAASAGAATIAALGALVAWGAGSALTEDTPRVGAWSLTLLALVLVLAVLVVGARWLRSPARQAGWLVVVVVVSMAGIAGLAWADEPRLEPDRVEQQVSLGGGEQEAAIELAPAAVGTNDVTVAVTTAEGQPAEEAQGAYLRYTPLERSGGAFRHDLEAAGPGRFTTEQLVVPFEGRWRVELHVAFSAFEESLVSFETTIRPNRRL